MLIKILKTDWNPYMLVKVKRLFLIICLGCGSKFKPRSGRKVTYTTLVQQDLLAYPTLSRHLPSLRKD